MINSEKLTSFTFFYPHISGEFINNQTSEFQNKLLSMSKMHKWRSRAMFRQFGIQKCQATINMDQRVTLLFVAYILLCSLNIMIVINSFVILSGTYAAY